jgi:hypothetical protein
MRKLEIVCYVSMIFASLLATGTLLERRFKQPTTATITSASKLDGSIEGSTLRLPGARWGDSSMNIVLYVNSNCHFCTESSPLYRQLVQVRKDASAVSLTAVSTEAPEITKRYLQQQAINVDHILQASLAEAGVRGTPAILAVDSSAVIRKAFFGKLDKPREDRLVAMVGGGKF